MFRTAAEAIGCWIAPLPIVGVGIVESLRNTEFSAVVVLMFSLITYLGALGFVLVLGYPTYRLLARVNAFRWWSSILSGFVIGLVVTMSISHPAAFLSKGALINAAAAATSGLLFWIIQRGKWGGNVTP
jgi:hypothetical protein